jgi:hypothetical protein
LDAGEPPVQIYGLVPGRTPPDLSVRLRDTTRMRGLVHLEVKAEITQGIPGPRQVCRRDQQVGVEVAARRAIAI